MSGERASYSGARKAAPLLHDVLGNGHPDGGVRLYLSAEMKPALAASGACAPEPLLHRQARQRAALLYRAEGRRFVTAMLELLGPAGWRDVRVEDVAAAAGIHPANARRWLRRCDDDGILRWLRKVGRGAVSRLALVAKNARVSRFIACARRRKNKTLKTLNTAGASDADRADAALELLRKIHQQDRERLRLYREKRGEEAERLRVVRAMEHELLPELWDADERTGLTLARLILSAPRPIREGELLLLRDRLTGQLPDGRWSSIDTDRPSAYVYGALLNSSQGRGGWAGYYELEPTWR